MTGPRRHGRGVVRRGLPGVKGHVEPQSHGRVSLTSTLGRLEAKGSVRLVPDENAGRSKRVLPTRAGRDARRESVRAARPLLSRARAAAPRRAVEELLPRLEELGTWPDRKRIA